MCVCVHVCEHVCVHMCVDISTGMRATLQVCHAGPSEAVHYLGKRTEMMETFQGYSSRKWLLLARH